MSAEQIDQGMAELPQVLNQSAGSTGGCCQFMRSGKMTAALASTAFVAILAAAYFAGQASQASQAATSQLSVPYIDATGAVTGDGYSLATGYATESSEAVFVLDHNSGLLQCSIIYPRSTATNKVLGVFTTRVTELLGGSGKGSKYIMTTGRSEFQSSSQSPAASTAVYVLDTGTGNWIAYGIPFNRQAMNALRPQQGALIPVGQGTGNPMVERDTMR